MGDDSLNTVGGHCPTCGQEYRPGFTVCADDGTELVPGPAPAPNEDAESDEEASRGVARTDVPDLRSEHGPPAILGSWPAQDAILLAGRLRAAGIRAMAESDVDHNPYHLPSMSGGVRVLVVPEDLERARGITQRVLERAAVEEEAGE
jgi:hypothetical protein